MNSTNTPIGFATNIDKRHVISLSGEINAATGVMAATFLAAITYANSAAQLGATNDLFGFDAYGDFYLDNPKLGEARSGWKTFTADFTRFANGSGVAITGNAS